MAIICRICLDCSTRSCCSQSQGPFCCTGHLLSDSHGQVPSFRCVARFSLCLPLAWCGFAVSLYPDPPPGLLPSCSPRSPEGLKCSYVCTAVRPQNPYKPQSSRALVIRTPTKKSPNLQKQPYPFKRPEPTANGPEASSVGLALLSFRSCLGWQAAALPPRPLPAGGSLDVDSSSRCLGFPDSSQEMYNT